MTTSFRKSALLCAAPFLLGACQSNDAATPAALKAADSETMAAVEAMLAEAMDRARVELGPGDLTQMSTITVLPPPLGPGEDHSPARPVQFDIMVKGGACYVVRRDTGEEYALDGVACRPLGD